MNRFQQSVTKTVVIALAVTLITASWYSPFQQVANEQVDAGLKAALISFASARALNAVISVTQGTQVGLQPGGLGVTLSLGQVLDPIIESARRSLALGRHLRDACASAARAGNDKGPLAGPFGVRGWADQLPQPRPLMRVSAVLAWISPKPNLVSRPAAPRS